MEPTPVFLPGESQGRGSQAGYHLWDHTESDTTEATFQQQHWEKKGLSDNLYFICPCYSL